jgi:hypothetical protein
LTNQKSKSDGLSKIISGLGSIMSGQSHGPASEESGIDLSIIGDIIGGLSSLSGGSYKSKRSMDNSIDKESSDFDFDGMLNIASMFMGQTGNAEGFMGLVPIFLDTFSGKNSRQDHSDHSWFMPPILENAHLMWDHFRLVDLPFF